MLADRFGLSLSTSSAAARDAYVDASERALTFYPGALAAYDNAIAADPRFALAHAGKAQVLMREGNVAGARTALVAAVELTAGLTEREASHIAIFDLGSSGQTDAAIAAVNKHLTAWPCDALVISIAANPNGLIGGSGRFGQKHQIAELMDSVAPHYGDDYWFLSYHAMALSEDGELAEARPKDRAVGGAEPEKRARRPRVCPCLLRKRRTGDRAGLSVAVARRVSARRILLRSLELASVAGRNRARPFGGGTTALPRRHRA